METEKTDFLQKLAQLRADTCSRLPTPQLAVLARLTARLRKCGIIKKSLQPGETAANFSFIDPGNNHTSLYELLERGPVVINFFRGMWCPYCRAEVEAYEAIRPKLEALGATYLAITPQKPTDATAHPQMIFDNHSDIARQFDLVYTLTDEEIRLFGERGVKLDEVNESGKWELPLPATYVIAQDRTVAFQFVDVDFRSRCCPIDLLREVEMLQR